MSDTNAQHTTPAHGACEMPGITMTHPGTSHPGTSHPGTTHPGAASQQRPGFYGKPPGEFELVPQEFWPTTLFLRKYRDHTRDAPAIIKHLYDLKAQQAAAAANNIASGVAKGMKSKDGLFESTFDLFTSTTCPELQTLVRFIESSVRKAVWHVNGRSVDANRIKVDFVESWFHITNSNGFHDAHYHGGCSWCGIYYVQMPDLPSPNGEHAPVGVNRFFAPRSAGGLLADYGNRYLNITNVDFKPVPGTLVLFPAYLLHSALPYIGTDDRIVMAFNSTSTLTDP